MAEGLARSFCISVIVDWFWYQGSCRSALIPVIIRFILPASDVPGPVSLPTSHWGHSTSPATSTIGEHVPRHLGADMSQRLHEEMSGAHPGLDGAERVLDGLAAPAHGLRVLVEAALHRLEHMLMLPSADAALPAGSAAILDGTTGASGRPVAAQRQSVFFSREAISTPALLSRKTPLRRCKLPTRFDRAAV